MTFGEVEEKDKNPYGNADRGDNSKADWAKDAELRMGKPVALGDEAKSSGMIRTEAEKAISDLEARFPEVAKRLNLNGIDLNDPMAALVARDQAVSLTREAEGQQLQQAVGTGVAALVGGAVALGAGSEALAGATSKDNKDHALAGAGGLLGISSAENGSVATNVLDGNDPLKALNLNRAAAASPALALGLQNPQFEQLLASSSIKDPMAFADPQNVNRGDLGYLSTPAVPNLVAAVEKSQSAGASRFV